MLIQRLITKEDPWHVHKTLGVVVLISYAWRLSMVVSNCTDMGFASHPQWTVPTLLLHLCLSLSSFAFDKIPPQRIKTDGGRIWPEYRLHSGIFATRSLACIALNWYYDQHQHHDDENRSSSRSSSNTFDYHYYYSKMNLVIVLACMACADMASHSVGRYHSRSVRDLKAPATAKYYFSLMQFMITAQIVVGMHRNSLHFYACLVIQVTAFLFTLRRRQVVSHTFNLVVYGLLLAGGYATGLYECMRQSTNRDLPLLTQPAAVAVTTCTAILCRLGPWPSLNKYVVWIFVHAVVVEGTLRPTLNGSETSWLTPHEIMASGWISVGLMIALGVYKVWSTGACSYSKIEKNV